MRVALAVVVVVVVVVALAASVGPPGHTYRRNADFAACMGEAWPPVDEESFEVLQRCHDTQQYAIACKNKIALATTTIKNFGSKSTRKWSASEADSCRDRMASKQEGFDPNTKKFGCPKDKKELLALLNSLERG